MAVPAALTGFLLAFLSGPALATTTDALKVATITSIIRLVRVQERDGAKVIAAKRGMQLPEGAKVMTLEGSFAEVTFSPAHFVKLGPATTLSITRNRKPERGVLRILLKVVKGRVRAAIDRFIADDADFGMYGHTVVTAVKGTEYEFIREAANRVTVVVETGKVAVAESKGESLDDVDKVFIGLLMGTLGIKLLEGNKLDFMPGMPFPSPVPIPKNFMSPFAAPQTAAPKPAGPAVDRHEHPERGKADGKTGGKTAPSVPSVPGLPGLGFP